jgi:hypothetical protein
MILTGGKSKSRETRFSDTAHRKYTCADPSLNPVVCDKKYANNDLYLEAVTLPQYSCESLVSKTAVSDERADLPFVRVS